MEYLKIYESFFEEQKKLNKEVTDILKKNKDATNSLIEEIEDFLVELKDKYKIKSEIHFVDGADLCNYTYLINIFIMDVLSSNLDSDINQLRLFENEYKKEYSIQYAVSIGDSKYINANRFHHVNDLLDLKKRVTSWKESFVHKYHISISIRENKIVTN